MEYNNDYFVTDTGNNRMQKVVNVPITLYKSIQGRYFVGQTEAMWVGNGSNSWAGLFNPSNSNIDLFANVITISNFSDQNLTAEIWLNAKFLVSGTISNKISPANTAMEPRLNNKVKIRFVQSTDETPQYGVNIFERIVPPNSTLVSEEDGKFIVPSCGNYTVVIKSNSLDLSKVVVAFGWWEDPSTDKTYRT